LVVAQTEQDDVALVDPDFLPQFATDMCEAAGAVEALGFETAVSEHLDDLGVFLAFFFEDKLALFVVVFVLTTTSVLATLSGVLVHGQYGVHERVEDVALVLQRRVDISCHPVCGCVERLGAMRDGGAAPPWQESVRTFPLFFGILSSR
jgi:hypothetical protein